MKIFLGSDHAGFKLKQKVKLFLIKKKYNVIDKGNLRYEPKDDYPKFAYKVAKAVSKTKNLGILFCGSSEGMCIAANKVKGIRAVAVKNIKDARLSRLHNDANILCLSGWSLPETKAKRIVTVWLKTNFSFELRHIRRLKQIERIENA